MPIWTTPDTLPVRSLWALANRAPKLSPRCSRTDQPRSIAWMGPAPTAWSRSPVKARWQRSVPKVCAQTSRVSSSAADARSAATDMPTSRPNRVLTMSGHRRLGDHQHVYVVHDSTRQKSRAVRTVPRTDPETLDRVPSARGW